ncbi:MAG: hypothetical protein Q8J78_06215 [Moraxellaceae bacterium]|nr:hypothetical protein [Moraxellaceae bacterium]
MKKSILLSSMVLAGLGSGAVQAESMQIAMLQEAIFSGKTFLDARLRAEYVDFETTPETDAETLRTALGYRTGDYKGLKYFIEFENVSSLGNGDYNSGATGLGNNKAQFGQIPDPSLTQLNQSYLEGYGFKAGRQKLIYDNARFVGDVGWRQNDQVFDAVSYSNKTLVKDLTLGAAYLYRVHNIFGATRAVEAPMLNVKYAAFPQAKVAAFYYAVEEKSTPTASWEHVGLRVDGVVGNFLYEVALADQQDYKNSLTADAGYSDIQLGYKFGPVTVKAQMETLEKGFKTPLATLHAFNGWADRFLNTPANGLVDTNLKASAKLGDYTLQLAVHDFESEAVNETFGQEVNFSVARPLTSKVNALFKVASFNADGSVVGFMNDTTKVWLQFAYKM